MNFEKRYPAFSVRVHEGAIRTGTDQAGLDAFLEQLLDELTFRYGLAACFDAKALLERHPDADPGQVASLLGQVLLDEPVDATEAAMRILLADLRLRMRETEPRQAFDPLFGGKTGGGADDLATQRVRTEILRQICHLAKSCDQYRPRGLKSRELQRGSKAALLMPGSARVLALQPPSGSEKQTLSRTGGRHD